MSDNGIEWMSGYCSEQLEHCQLAPDDITSLQESESGVPTPFARWDEQEGRAVITFSIVNNQRGLSTRGFLLTLNSGIKGPPVRQRVYLQVR